MRLVSLNRIDESVQHVLSEITFALLSQTDSDHLAERFRHVTVKGRHAQRLSPVVSIRGIQDREVVVVLLRVMSESEAFLDLIRRVERHAQEAVIVINRLHFVKRRISLIDIHGVVGNLEESTTVHTDLLTFITHLQECIVELAVEFFHVLRTLFIILMPIEDLLRLVGRLFLDAQQILHQLVRFQIKLTVSTRS